MKIGLEAAILVFFGAICAATGALGASAVIGKQHDAERQLVSRALADVDAVCYAAKRSKARSYVICEFDNGERVLVKRPVGL